MHRLRNWRWSALAVAFVSTAPVARAGMITPDSIPNPPSAVASANGTPVYPSNYVGLQYKGLGLNFAGGSAITQLNGVSVWTPVSPPPRMVGPSSSGSIDYAWSVAGSLVSPGSLNSMSVSSLSVEILGNRPISMSVYGLNGQRLNITPVIGSTAGVQDWKFTGAGISSFSVAADPSGVVHPATASNPAWGVAGTSFTPASAPEPSSLFLAGLGALGIATRLRWRRIRQLA
jgi:hypothetical protein